MKIGIGVTTVPERREVSANTISMIEKYLPSEYELVVIYDDYHRGVAVSKNECLEKLYNTGCDHIFLFDDDTYPIAPGWWKPYVESKEPHLMYQFKLPGKPSTDMQEVYRDDEIVAYTHTRGAMIYVTKEVLDTVGGFDTRYYNGFEHPDYTNRIHNAGLTTHRAMDLVGSDKLLYCLDQHNKIKSSIKNDVVHRIKNHKLYKEQWRSKEYKEYRS
jgi:hypothetical protein